ncbi:acyltransferase [Comamonas sp. NoAH]|uniref:acyltransferase n=1 Tax=Comamonas halotolerans TaxID=3041496 RepID=UPI0024E0963C|nr:acyltransferase [Comamonas sp. NoAH]
MKHRIYHSNDLRERVPELADVLHVSPESLLEALEWCLANDVIFEEGEGLGRSYSICSVDITPRISHPLGRRLYEFLKQEIPTQLVPLYGLNWRTLKDRSLRVWEQLYNMFVNKIPSHHVRLAWLRLGGARIGKGSSIWRNTEVLGIENLRIGDDSVIGWHCQVDARAGLTIGDHVAIASHVLIIAGSHDLTAPEFWSVSAPIYIDDYAWIASRALIGHGAHIGRGAVVTANTIVSKAVPPYKIIGGSGARAIGERPHDLNYKVGGKGLFTFLH